MSARAVQPDSWFHGMECRQTDLSEVKQRFVQGVRRAWVHAYSDRSLAGVTALIESWCEHDSHAQNYFDHLVPTDDAFVAMATEVWALARLPDTRRS